MKIYLLFPAILWVVLSQLSTLTWPSQLYLFFILDYERSKLHSFIHMTFPFDLFDICFTDVKNELDFIHLPLFLLAYFLHLLPSSRIYGWFCGVTIRLTIICIYHYQNIVKIWLTDWHRQTDKNDLFDLCGIKSFFHFHSQIQNMY